MNSFSSDVKKELSQINNLSKKELVKAELMGYILTGISDNFTTQSEYNINRFAKLLTNAKIDDFSISISGKNYTIKTKHKIEIDKSVKDIKDQEEERAVVRGAFYGGRHDFKTKQKISFRNCF